MKVTYKTGKFTVEAEGNTTEIFKQLASFDSVFGNCKNKANDSENIGFRHRVVDENDYFEMYDKDTFHTLKFGKTKKDGSLFPRRKDADGNYFPDGGWVKYDPNAPKVKSANNNGKTDSAEIPF
tara:strand:+ start:5477 stop:5848 length:372 start_codon:yes stop_codon:yes gene_type:complete